jgi:hypothetical protein
MINVLTTQLLHIKQTNKTNKMTNKTQRSLWRTALATGLVALSTFVGTGTTPASAEETTPKAPITLRARTEHTDSPGMDFSKYTFETGNQDQFLRAYNYSGDKGDYSSAGFNNWELGGVYGTTGEKKGFGIEPNLVLGNSHLIGTFERDTKNNKERKGAEANYTLGKVTLGGAYDNCDGNESVIGNVIVRSLPNIYGAGIKRGDEANSALAFYGHFGPKETWGTRSWVRYDEVSATDSKVFSLDAIFAQNPTFFEIPHISSYNWLVSRNSIEGGLLGKSLVENPCSTEAVALNNRSKGGIVSELSGCVTETDGKTTGNAKVDLGYTLPINKLKTGLVGFYNYDVSGEGKNKVGASGLLAYGDFCLTSTFTHDTSTDRNGLYASLNWARKF